MKGHWIVCFYHLEHWWCQKKYIWKCRQTNTAKWGLSCQDSWKHFCVVMWSVIHTPQGSAVALFLGYAAITESKGKYVLRQPKPTQRTQTTPLVKSFSPIYDSKITIIYEQHTKLKKNMYTHFMEDKLSVFWFPERKYCSRKSVLSPLFMMVRKSCTRRNRLWLSRNPKNSSRMCLRG